MFLILPLQTHCKSAQTIESKGCRCRPKRAAPNLFVYLLPAYSPELNLIEIIWRMIKYHWPPLNAYDSYKDLFRELGKVLKGIGSKYQINFAS
jgi:transposase